MTTRLHGCNKPRKIEPKYLVQDGYMLRFDPEVGHVLGVPKFKEIQTLDSAAMCRYDLRQKDPACEGCPTPWDVKYLKEAGLAK